MPLRQRGRVLFGWRLVGTDKVWPAILGDPPRFIPGSKWEEIFR